MAQILITGAILRSPEERHTIKRDGLVQHIPCGGLSLLMRDAIVLNAQRPLRRRIRGDITRHPDIVSDPQLLIRLQAAILCQREIVDKVGSRFDPGGKQHHRRVQQPSALELHATHPLVAL